MSVDRRKAALPRALAAALLSWAASAGAGTVEIPRLETPVGSGMSASASLSASPSALPALSPAALTPLGAPVAAPVLAPPLAAPAALPAAAVPVTAAGAGTPAGPGNTCPLSGVNLCAGKPRENPDNSCVASGCYDYVPWILKYSNQFGVDANLLKAVMMQESSCDPSKRSASSYGLMALQPATANIVRQKCGIQSSVDGQWLIDHPAESICLSAAYLTTIKSGICGTDVRNIAAGYNAGPGRCAVSSDCAGQQSCSNEPVRQWECLYDNPQQTVCNKGLDQTRNYAINVLYCQQNPGF